MLYLVWAPGDQNTCILPSEHVCPKPTNWDLRKNRLLGHCKLLGIISFGHLLERVVRSIVKEGPDKKCKCQSYS